MTVPMQSVGWSIRALGLDLEELAAAARVPLEGRRTLLYEEGVALWRAAERLLDDPTVGHRAGVFVRPHEMGPLGGIMAHAVDLHQALIDLCSVLPLVLPGSLSLQETEAGLTVYYETPPSPVRTRHGVECVFASLVAHARHCTRSSFPLQAVEFANPPPARPPVYDEFYGVPVGWEAERSSVAFDHATLRLPMSAANSPLSRLLMQHAEETLGAVPLVERQVVRAILAALNLGEATIAATAREMGVSVRTLQRRLDVAEVSFTDLRARVLRSRAERMLRDSELSVEEIGEACGYSSRTGFDRAFRAWTGMTPATFRRGR